MARYTDKQITLAKTIYEAGDSLLSASKQANIPEATLRRYAKSLGWIHGELQQIPNFDIDEEQHRGAKHSQHDVLRQQFIEQQLNCKFVRIKV